MGSKAGLSVSPGCLRSLRLAAEPRGAAQQLLVGALWEIPGVCIGIALGIMYLRTVSK